MIVYGELYAKRVGNKTYTIVDIALLSLFLVMMSKAVFDKCCLAKEFWKNAANLQEITHAEV